MGMRGRKSSVELAAVKETTQIHELLKIDEPPKDLNEAQSGVWRTVMASSSGDLISPEQYDLLKEYCRTVVTGNALAKKLNDYQWDENSPDAYQDLRQWDKLLTMQHKNQSVMSTLATKLRIAVSSSLRASEAATILKHSDKQNLDPLMFN